MRPRSLRRHGRLRLSHPPRRLHRLPSRTDHSARTAHPPRDHLREMTGPAWTERPVPAPVAPPWSLPGQVLQHLRVAGGLAAGQQERSGAADITAEGVGVKGPADRTSRPGRGCGCRRWTRPPRSLSAMRRTVPVCSRTSPARSNGRGDTDGSRATELRVNLRVPTALAGGSDGLPGALKFSQLASSLTRAIAMRFAEPGPVVSDPVGHRVIVKRPSGNRGRSASSRRSAAFPVLFVDGPQYSR